MPLFSPMFGVVKLLTCSNRVGSEAFVKCKTGYKTSGSENRTCLSNGTWSGKDTKCTSEYKYILYYIIFLIPIFQGRISFFPFILLYTRNSMDLDVVYIRSHEFR